MYTMVIMMAATTGGDVAAFGRTSSCHGGSGCTGTVMAAPVSSCYGSTSSCHGSSSCHGGGGLFGLRNGGGLFGKKGGSCHGGSSCMGSTVGGGCYGSGYGAPVVYGAPVGGCVPTMGTVGGPVMTPPVNMPVDPAKKVDPAKPVVDPNKKQD